MSQAPFEHEPVLRTEVVALLTAAPALRPGALVVDATLGGGGHAAALLEAAPGLRLLGLDRDPAAVEAASARLAAVADRVTVRHLRFDALAAAVADLAGDAHAGDGPVVAGVLFDLGVSSPQLDRPERGFSYRVDAPLDMRMDPTSGTTAADVVNTYAEGELARLFAENGEGRFARRIARAVVAARPLATTGQLVDVVKAAIPAPARRTGGHPAKRVFQALRVEVNAELEVLRPALDAALGALVPGGRCVVLTYHSGEDRIVKAAFRAAATGGCTCPPGLPCVCGARATVRILRPEHRSPSAAEVAANPRAESARLRAVEKVESDTAPSAASAASEGTPA